MQDDIALTHPRTVASTGSPGLALVFGASGYVGSHLVPRLLASGCRVRAAARTLGVLAARDWPNVELAEADALKPDTLANCLAGVETAYYLVHSMAAGRDFAKLDLEAAGNFADAAARAGVRRIVYLGGLVPANADSEHILSRRDTGDRLRRGSVPVTEIRAGIIVGPGSAAFEIIRDLVMHLPIMVTPRWVRAKSPPIALDNLLEYLVRAPSLEATANRVFDAAGPEMLSYEDMMRWVAASVGKRPLIVPVPVLSPRLSSYWLGLVTAVPSRIARSLIAGLKHDYSADDAELRRLIPQRLLDFREAVAAAFEAEKNNVVAARWAEGAFMFRKHRADYAYYAKRTGGSAQTAASPEAVWREVEAIGGERRYFACNLLWKVRELIDWVAGGPGLNYGRRHPQELRLGDAVDSWRVIGIEPGARLTLMMGMKAPGAGVLEFEIAPLPDGNTRVSATAYWHPAGVWGLLYWYALVPAHLLLFKRMTAAIARRAAAS
jgi:uncharacterized protein YbjT (DUF2867 family)